jgi:flavodoxin/NAD-dependent dihydropyrimidine dehydrogenase PreA subunit
MKCVIIYFSVTGNTEKIAKAIQAGVKQAAGNCDIIKIKDANPRRLYEYDLIGLGSPIMGLEPDPDNVRAFIKNLWSVGGKHAFVFSTHGANPDPFFPSIVPKLKQRGLVVIGMGDWYGSCYLSETPQPYPTAGHPDEIDFKEAEEFGKEMVERSRRIAAGETRLIPPVPPAPPSIRVPKELRDIFKSSLKFHEEKCVYPKCRLCMDNCPVYGIDLSVKRAVIAKPCISCDLCSKICPTGAIEADDYYGQRAAQLTQDFVKSELLSHLEKNEAEGRFRRLVPVEKIGWDTSFYKVHNKHPRWIIGKGPR